MNPHKKHKKEERRYDAFLPYQAHLLISGFTRHLVREHQLLQIPAAICQLIESFYPKIRPVVSWNDTKYLVTNCNYTIKGIADCSGYLIFPENNNGQGFKSGVHYWSMKCVNCVACYRYIGVMYDHRLPDQRDMFLSLTKKETDKLFNSGNVRHYLFPQISGGWNVGEIATVKLDCDHWKISYKCGDGEWQQWTTKQIKMKRAYHFVMRMCAYKGNHFECVETPSYHLDP